MARPKGKIRLVAEAAGLDHQTVRRALATADVDIEALDFDKAVQTVKAIADKDRVLGNATLGRGEGGDANTNALASARAEAERHRAEKLRLQNEKLAGSLISRDAVTETVVRLFGDLRVALMAVGVRLAPRVSGSTDQKVVARLIEDELRHTLITFADADRILRQIDDEALS
ncbi:hypothetical protein [Bradyrhizobium sp. STM 3809]|uniref:hypothetical protein n=1 Tax=Bradyrhizobium sp. STM 3809 TaxID=551936 RepID=UPI0002408E64|nr:hypothetical protein [Bradyrhizobium sp. STM 3809]CCE01128.1 conserved hypothetical protein [Bradyrhizobium sp. STM 3809]